MPVAKKDLKVYGSAVMPDDDTTTAIGGAADTSKSVVFTDPAPAGNIQVVSDSASDTTQSVTVTGRDSSGVIVSETAALNGTTPVAMTTNTDWATLLKAVKSATTAGNVAAMAVTAEHSGTAQGAGGSASNEITLATGASSVDDAYVGMVIRLTGGTGSGQLRQIIEYNGTTKVAVVDQDFGTQPDATTTYDIAEGMFFAKAPNEITEVRRLFYDAAADAAGGADKSYYEKVFFYNTNATLALTNAVISEVSDAAGVVDFALESVLDGTDTNGTGNNRQVAPTGYTFDSTQKNVANSQNHSPGSGQGVWLRLTLVAGAAAQKTSVTMRESGTTV